MAITATVAWLCAPRTGGSAPFSVEVFSTQGSCNGPQPCCSAWTELLEGAHEPCSMWAAAVDTCERGVFHAGVAGC